MLRAIILAFIGLMSSSQASFAQLGKVQWISVDPPHKVSNPDFLSTYGPFCMNGNAYWFEYTHNPMMGKETGYYGFMTSGTGSDKTVSKELPLAISGDQGGMLGVLATDDHFVVIFQTLADKGRTVNLWAQRYDPQDLSPTGDAVQVGTIELESTPSYRPVSWWAIRMSDDKSKMLIYYDDLGRGTDRYMFASVFTSELQPLWHGIQGRRPYESELKDGGFVHDSDRDMVLTNKGALVISARQLKEGEKVVWNSRDMERYFDRTLIRWEDKKFLAKDHPALPERVMHSEVYTENGTVLLHASLGPGSANTYTVDEQLGSTLLEEYKVQAGSSTTIVRSEAGSKYLLSLGGSGLKVTPIDPAGTMGKVIDIPRWNLPWSGAFEYHGKLYITANVQTKDIKSYSKGGKLEPAYSAYKLIPVVLVVENDKVSDLEAVFPEEEGGERDKIKYGLPTYPEAPFCGRFMERSRDKSRPGLVVRYVE